MEMALPYEPFIFGVKINPHLLLEYLAFMVGFRYYVVQRKRNADAISSNNRLSIIMGAVFGALVFSRVMAFLENPAVHYDLGLLHMLNNKTIMGGLFGGLIGVELMKKYIGEKQSSGDLFTLPLILGIIIGRIGCFLAGTKEFTYGRETKLIFGMDLGDGLLRHPLPLYEIAFLSLLFFVVKKQQERPAKPASGTYFKMFMVGYFFFRFCVEFLKPNLFLIMGLSSIQYLCLLCLLYYRKTVLNGLSYASQKLHLL